MSENSFPEYDAEKARQEYESLPPEELVELMLVRDGIILTQHNALVIQTLSGHEATRSSLIDDVTGISNRKGFALAYEERQHIHADADAHEKSMYIHRRETDKAGKKNFVFLIDVDNFKQINDMLGHPKGNIALRNIGKVLTEVLRSIDAFARIGGDEFGVLLSDTTEAEALMVADRLRQKAKERMKTDTLDIKPSLSIGMAVVDHTLPLDDMLQPADDAMYVAKREGGNRIHVYDPTRAYLGPA